MFSAAARRFDLGYAANAGDPVRSTSGDGCLHWNVDGDSIVTSPWLAQLFSLNELGERQGISFEHFLSIIHEGDGDCIRHSLERAIGDGLVFDKTYRVTSVSLGTRWIRSKAGCYYNDEGQPVQMTGFAVEAVLSSSTLHAAIVDRLSEARKLPLQLKKKR